MADEAPRSGFDHLQAAALEMIAAAKAFLDVAERVVQDPGAVGSAALAVGQLARAVVQAAHREGPAGDESDVDADDEDGEAQVPAPGADTGALQRIPLS